VRADKIESDDVDVFLDGAVAIISGVGGRPV